MTRRFPYFLLALGTIGMALYPRLLPADAPPFWRGDLGLGLVMGVFLGVELVGVLLALPQRRCRRAA